MKEISPKELQKINEKSFKNTQKVFRRRLREIAAGGEKEATYKANEYCCGEQIKPWLESLGFKVRDKGWGSWYEITWPEESILGDWIFDPHTYDYVCSECGKHSEYTSHYCPNCGKKLKPIEGRNYDTK